MRILQVHNYCRLPGGEDQVFAAEGQLLEAHGDHVCRYQIHNDRISTLTCLSDVRNTVWNKSIYKELRALIQREHPQVAHFHNTFPLVSPSAYYAAAAEGVPVVQTLHNYRLVCPAATLFRDGKICEECIEKRSFWPGVTHGCYRSNRATTAVAAAMLAIHRVIDTWEASIDIYIALSDFSRRKFVEAGLPAEKIVVKPNFVEPRQSLRPQKQNFVLFVGRLSREKGIRTLLEAWRYAGHSWQLKIAGDGPLAPEVRDAATRMSTIEWLGQQPYSAIRSLMASAKLLIVPSEWYETFGRVVIEAYAEGTPVVASAIGALPELVVPGKTGLLFRASDPRDLAAQLQWAYHHPEEVAAMGAQAHDAFVSKYDPNTNYEQLHSVYSRLDPNKEARYGPGWMQSQTA